MNLTLRIEIDGETRRALRYHVEGGDPLKTLKGDDKKLRQALATLEPALLAKAEEALAAVRQRFAVDHAHELQQRAGLQPPEKPAVEIPGWLEQCFEADPEPLMTPQEALGGYTS